VNVRETKLPGVLVIEPRLFHDQRGYFSETFQESRYAEHGVCGPFVQDNVSYSTKGVLRGLHYQWPDPQAKLITVLSGEVLDVAVDIHRDSPTYGQWISETLSSDNLKQLYVPRGYAHGFYVFSDSAVVLYKVDAYYNPTGAKSLLWNDPEIGVEWPSATPILAKQDAEAPPLNELTIQFSPLS